MAARPPQKPSAPLAIYSVTGAEARAQSDHVAVEEPLEIRLRARFDSPDPAADGDLRTISLTMRTPGSSREEDAELALGFLFSEGLLRSAAEVASVEFPEAESEAVVVSLHPEVRVAWRSLGLERHFFTTSACGVCGKSALAALAATPPEPLRPAAHGPRLEPGVLHQLTGTLRAAQATFSTTGGLHAAGLFDAAGQLLLVREDIGRHNAVDKLLGAQLRRGHSSSSLALHDQLLVVSGRASFELVQKARMACIPIFVAVSAPSSLAVELARDCGMTLVAFARDGRCNVYSTPERLALKLNTVAS